MATDRTNIGYKFENGDIPSQGDFQEVFNSFIHKDEDKADFQMVETGTDDQHYVTPALLRAGLQNIGIITGNSYMPLKEHFDNFVGNTITLQYAPVNFSVKVFKNGQLLLEKEGEGNDGDYIINYEMAKITFSGNIDNRNVEVDYWYKNLTPNPGGGDPGEQIDFTSFLHTSGNETKNGILTFNNTTPTSTSGIVLTNSGADAGAKVLDVTVSGAGSGISVQNTATGTGIKVSNTGAGAGLQVNSSSTATGDPLQVSKDNVVKAKIDAEGIITAKKFVSEGGTDVKFVKGDGSLDDTVYAEDTKVIHIEGNEERDGALKLTHNNSVEDVLTITKNNSANCLKLVQNSSSSATTSTFDTNTENNNRKAISVQKIQVEKAFITHDGNVSGTSFTTLNEKADITDGFLTLAPSDSATAMAGHAKLYAKTDGTTDLYVMGSDGVEKKIGASGGDLDNVLHKTGYATETKTGELVIDSGTANVSGLKLNRITQTRNSYATVPSNTYGLISVGNTFYRAGNYLVKIENQVATTIGVGMGAGYSICYNSANNKIYIGGNSSRIRSMNPDGSDNQIVAQFSVGNQNFYGITIASDNNLYVLEYSTGNIHRSTLGGVKTENFANVGVDINSGLISGNNGFIYASHNNTIKKIDIASGVVTDFVTLAKRITSLFLHSDGYIYANTIDSVARILLDGTNLTENWASGLLPPNRAIYGICSQNGELYIADGLAISKLIQPQKALKTDPAGLVVSSTYLEDVQYLKATDLDLSSYAKTASPNLTGIPTVPTAALGTNTSQVSNTEFVTNAVSNAVSSGTYTPTVTNGANVTGSLLDRASYTRVGNTITVSISVSATYNGTNGFGNVRVTLPQNRGSASILNVGSGSAAESGVSSSYLAVYCQSQSNSTVNLIFKPGTAVTSTFYIVAVLQYSILE